MKLMIWQKKALAFKYKNPKLYELLYSEFSIVAVKCDLVTDARNKRSAEFVDKFKSGMTLAEIGRGAGISRERVRQILAKAGLNKNDGGNATRLFINIEAKRDKLVLIKRKREARHFEKFGCAEEFISSISPLARSDKNHPITKFIMQRKNATRQRGICWELTFREWWDIWQESGHWKQRGRGKGYCMARLGDNGPYKKGNVEIITCGQNISDSYVSKPWKERFLGIHYFQSLQK